MLLEHFLYTKKKIQTQTLYLSQKIKSKCITDLNVKHKTKKPEYRRKSIQGMMMSFYKQHQKQSIEEKIVELESIKIKNPPLWKTLLEKSQSTDQGKVFTKHIFDKGFVSKIYNELLKFNNRKTQKDLNRYPPHLSREDIQMQISV